MKNKKTIIISSLIILLIVSAIIIFYLQNKKEYFKELKYDEIIEKVNNKESFTLCFTQTSCGHCAAFKPKLERIANEYKTPIYYIEIDLMNNSEVEELEKYFQFADTPTTTFVINGEEKTMANRLTGNVDSDKVIKKLKNMGLIEE